VPEETNAAAAAPLHALAAPRAPLQHGTSPHTPEHAPTPSPPPARSGLLDAVLDICGVPAAKFRPICSAIDKLDKEPWETVRAEMVDDKGLPPAVADRIGTMVQLRGEPRALHARLLADGVFAGHVGAGAALAELDTLFSYLDAMGALHRISFDLSLARGLDYYTGVIYEAVLLDPSYGVGSIAAGGRYDNLVGMFASPGECRRCCG
jgi:histidyl-tRNA synthetase